MAVKTDNKNSSCDFAISQIKSFLQRRAKWLLAWPIRTRPWTVTWWAITICWVLKKLRKGSSNFWWKMLTYEVSLELPVPAVFTRTIVSIILSRYSTTE